MPSWEERVLQGAPSPRDAQHRWQRIVQSAEDEGVSLEPLGENAIQVAALACQRAPYLATLLARDPTRLARVASDPYLRRAKPFEVAARELSERIRAAADDAALADAVRNYRADEMVRLGVRELELGTPLEVGMELSQLAGICLDVAIDYHDRALATRYGEPLYQDDDGQTRRAGLVVIGMGKLGGEELNFCSDIDLIYIYSSDNGLAGELSLHEYFSKLCKAVTRCIGETTDNDVVFHVDLRLRPEGSQGPIANSLISTERYYETFGRPWERQAWLKARPCAGDMALGEEVMRMMRPFVYSRTSSSDIIADVRDLNRRIKAELDGGAIDGGFDLKNGVGGIREIEFFVQALQLIHSPHHKQLRTRSTMTTLDQLLFTGLVTESERHSLASAYRFLRHLEHVIQLETGRQTQRMPTAPEHLELLAQRTGHPDYHGLRAELDRHTHAVKESFTTLGQEDAAPPDAVYLLLSAELSAEREMGLLAELGFRSPDWAHAVLETLRRRAESPFARTASGAAARVAPALLGEIATSPDPDNALRHLSSLVSRRGSWSSIWRLMEENPVLVRLIASLFGTSEYLSQSFIAHPELIDRLLASDLAHPILDEAELREALDRRQIFERTDREEQWSALAAFKNAQVLRIGLADIGGTLEPLQVCQQLSLLAEVCVDCALRLVMDDVRERHGDARSENGELVPLAIVALGKLGGRELGYASDLDLVFVYSEDGESDGASPVDNVTYMSRIAQRLMRGLHTLHPGGRLYEIDTRLRPSGSKGLLVSTLRGWERYHAESAKLWERQALTKLRVITGDRSLGQSIETIARRFVYGARPGTQGVPPAAEIARTIRDMRDRIWNELADHTSIDVKAGRGGLIDIEFSAQLLQLVYGHDVADLRVVSTVEALEAAARHGVAPTETCALMVEGYHFLRRIEHRLRVVHDRSEHVLPTDPVELDKLARRAGYPDAARLNDAFLRWSRELHAAYEQIFMLSGLC